jgi:putative transcriptional regulator
MKSHRKRPPLAERIRKGVEKAIRHAKGEITLKTTTLELPDPPPEVGAAELTRLRLASGMSQAIFARLLNVSTKSVQSWEQGPRKPSQAALRLIQVFRHNPTGLLAAAGMSGPLVAAGAGTPIPTARRASPSRSSAVGRGEEMISGESR